MRLPHLLLLTASLAALSIGCPRRAPAPPRETPPPAPEVKVPEGCLADLSGNYRHAAEHTYRYAATDDGGTFALTVRRNFAALDGGLSDPLASIALERTPDGFRGKTHAEGFAAGVKCPLTFATEVLACTDAGVVLLTAMSAAVDEQCRVAPPTASTPRERQLLLRELPDGGFMSLPVDAGTPDAGFPYAPDAGAGADGGAGGDLDAGLDGGASAS